MPRQSNSADTKIISPWARRIRDLRVDRDMTQTAVADLLHVSQRVYADYELGNVRIPVDHLIRLAYYYNVDINYICSAAQDPRPFPQLSQGSELHTLLATVDEDSSNHQ